MNNELVIFNNEEFGQVRFATIDGKEYAVANDVAKALGYKSPKDAIRVHVDDKNKARTKYPTLGGVQEVTVINESGVCQLIQKSRNVSTELKEKLLKILFPNKDIVIATSRKEIEFIEQLEESLKAFDVIDGIKQYPIFNYRIDFYIPSLNIAIEYDENGHNNYTYEQQEGRQKEIEDKLKCRFIRVTDYESDLYNIGYVIKKIFEMQ